MLMIVYSTETSPRLRYILPVLFDAAGISGYHLTNHRDDYLSFDGPKLNYSPAPVAGDELWIKPSSLLYETIIQNQNPEPAEWDGLKIFFTTEGDLPFDIFAASFYLLTRYEEYLPHTKDMYGRYAHENSFAYKHGFLQQPLINLWLQNFTAKLQQKFSQLQLPPPEFRFVPTYDIDIAWSYLNKGFIRNAGGILKSLVKGEPVSILERLHVLSGNKKDPFDVYEWLDVLHAKHNLQPLYFFLLAQRVKGYDKNISPSSEALRKLVKQHAEKYATGIHPSWQSGDDEQLLSQEINFLQRISGKQVMMSRQHYIRFSLPGTFRQLIAAGIKEDYSMGNGSINGFRASYCLPYPWYDLEAEKTTALTIVPFCYMEANSLFEQHFTAAEAYDELLGYYHKVKEAGGHLVTIFHNHLITQQPAQAAWRSMYEQFLKNYFTPS